MVWRTSFLLAAFVVASTLLFATLTANSAAQDEPAAEAAGDTTAAETPEEKKERVTAERFLQLLERRPRLGTAFDRVYGYHVGRGTLEDFAKSLEERAKSENDGRLWMILGMVQMQRGQDLDAVEAFTKAQELLPEEPLASYYRGKMLVLVGRVDEAAEAMRTAIERKPARPDMLAIFQDLGRVFQRTGRNEDALEVWKELEELFPGDSQVQEEIAHILAEEGAIEAAIERYDKLAKNEKDRFRQVEMAIRSAQLKAQLGRHDDALREFETLLAKVNPDSWLHRDIRRRIEEVFWTSGDVDGLVNYYTQWVEKHPEDVDAMMRAARFLAVQRRLPEAEQWFAKAIEKAPSNTDARMALVEALVADGQYGKAAEAMKQLVEVVPDNPDYIVRWGELVFNDFERDELERNAEAARIWKTLLEKRGDDPVMVARVADLLRSTSDSEEAVALYRRAVELAPTEPQYREYLGEYLHQLGRKGEAIATWQGLASDERRTRDNQVRLSEVFSTFGYKQRALETMAQACELRPTFGHRARYAELLREADKHEEALAQLDLAEPLAEDPELREVLLEERIKNYQASGSLDQRIEAAEDAVAGDKANDAEAWRLLALLREADRKFQAACQAAERAATLAPGDASIWETAATLQERSGQFGEAIESYRKLATIDRRFLSNYLQQIATLEMQIGNTDEALAAGEQLIASAPGNAEHYRFFADLCFRVGQEERAFKALRRGVRSNPNDEQAVTYLARVLGEAFRTDEAIELYWQAFELATDVDARTAVIEQLAELYLRTNRFEALTDRLDSTAREQNRGREGTLWIAAAHQAAGDLGRARQLLEQLAREDSRDTKLLQQLVALARSEYDYDSAAEYQKRLVAISPTPEAEFQLANILLELGEIEQSEAIWLKLAQRKGSTSSLAETIGTLVKKEEYETAAALVDRTLADQANNWEALGWAMIVYVKLDDEDKAEQAAQRVASLNIDPAQPTEKTKEAIERRASSRNASQNYDPYANLGNSSRLMDLAGQIKQTLEPGSDNSYVSYQSSVFTPSCFQDVQAIARSVPLTSDSKDFDESAYVDKQVDDALESKEPAKLWQAMYYMVWEDPTLRYGQTENEEFERCVETLIDLQEPAAAQYRLQMFVNQRQRATSTGEAEADALDEARLEEVQRWSEMAEADMNGRPNYYQLYVASEFAKAGQEETALAIVDRYVEASKKQANAGASMLQAVNFLTSDRFIKDPSDELVGKAMDLFKQSLAETKATSNSGGYSSVYASLMSMLVEKDRFDEAVSSIDEVLKWQAGETSDLRPSQRNRISSSSGPLSYHRSVNGNYEQVVIEFPPPSGCFGAETIFCLHGAYQGSKDDKKQLAALREQLADWADEDSDDPFLKLARLLADASVAYWAEDYAHVKESLATASEMQLDTQFVDLARARMLYQAGEITEALAVVEALRPSNQSTLVDRELTILQLVLQLGDMDRAKQSAQRLFALRLPSDTEFKLADLMYQLGMRELGDRMMGRIRRRAGGKQDTLVQLMNRYAENGQNEEAAEIARQIIRRTEPSASRYRRTSENIQHEQALQVLARADQLGALIEQYEQLVERSPKSGKLINKLASFYEAAGRRKEAEELRLKAADSVPDDPQNLMAAGRQLAAMNQHEKAAEKFAAAVIKQPELLNNDYYEMRDSFKQSKSWDKLVDAMLQEGLKKFAQSYRMNEIVSELAEQKQADAINRLLRTALTDLSLGEFARMMYSVDSVNFEVEDDVVSLLAEKLTADDANITNISASTYVYSRSSDGRTRGLVNGLSSIVSQNKELQQQVVDAMKARLEKNEQELFPRVLLSMILIDSKQFDEAKQWIEPLVEKEKKTNDDGQAIYSLASQLVHGAKKPDYACDMLESVPDSAFRNDGSDFNYGPRGLQAYAYQQAGRKAACRRMLVDYMSNLEVDETQNRWNPGYGEYQYINTHAGLSRRFLEMGYPAEAFIAFRKAYSDADMLKRAERWGSNSARQRDQLSKQIREKTDADSIVRIVQAAILPDRGPDADAPKDDAKNGSAAESESETAENDKEADEASEQDVTKEEDTAEQAAEGARVAAEYLTKPEVARQSMIDVRVTMPLEQFTERLAEDEKLKQAIVEWLAQADVEDEVEDLPLKARVTWLLVCQAVHDESRSEVAASAVVAWMDANEPNLSTIEANSSEADPSDAQEAAESGEPEAEESETEESETTDSEVEQPEAEESDSSLAMQDELLLATAGNKLPPSVDRSVGVQMLRRARDAAEASDETDLVRGLDCQIAKLVAEDDPESARETWLRTLNDLLPVESEATN